MKNILLLLVLTALTAFGFESFNYVNKNYKITQSSELLKNYKTKIEPHFKKQKLQTFKSDDDISIAYKIFLVQDSKATIVISSGRTEGMVKYQELIYDLNRNGYSVYIHDHRGQGFSGRILGDSQKGHINDFDDYVLDLHYFVANIVKAEKKLFLLAHSMGGAIASLYLEKYPYDFDGAVLSSPMHQPELITATLTKIFCSLVESKKSNTSKYIIGTKSYDDAILNFKSNNLTHSKVRFEISKKAYEEYPSTKIGGPSIKWVAQSCLGSQRSVDMASKAVVPILLIQAGSDEIVNLKPQEKFCKNAQNCRGITIENAYHELFVEKDIYRNKAMSAMFDFFLEQEKN